MANEQAQFTDYLESAPYQQHFMPFLNNLLACHKRQGGVTEVCIVPGPDQPAYTGYFRPRDLETLVELLQPESDDEAGAGEHPRIGEAAVLVNVHPVAGKLPKGSPGTFSQCQGADGTDIVAYGLFAVAVEPVRPTGVPATQEERKLAEQAATEIFRYLKKHGIAGIPIDAGNWLGLLVPTTPYRDVRRALQDEQALLGLLDQAYSTAEVRVGPARGLPLPGTVMVDGVPSPDRPQRWVRVGPQKWPQDVDLFGLLADEIAAFRVKAEDEADEESSNAEREIQEDEDAEDDEEPGPEEPEDTAEPEEEVADQEVETGSEDEDAEDGSEEEADPPASKPAQAQQALAPVAGWDMETASRVVREVLKRADLAVREEVKGGERRFKWKDCPCADGQGGKPYGCYVAVGANGTFAPRCKHDKNLRWKDLKPLIGWGEHVKAVMRDLGVPPRSLPYRATEGGLVYLLRFKSRVERVRLTNFDARLVGEIEEDDGATCRRVFEVAATLGGKTTRFLVPAAQFRALNWVPERLGARAVLFPGAKAHAPAAIQTLSGPVAAQTLYTHLGWTRINGRPVYLHAGGGIGQDGEVPGVRVDLPEPLSRYRLPAPPGGDALRDAVRASMRVLEVAPDVVTFPLYAGIWRVAVGGVDFALQLTGPSGSGKTTKATLLQQHLGPELDAGHLPANWDSTGNSNELLAFYVKDGLLTVDDFVTAGGRSDGTRLHREADRLIRAQGNSAGRCRLRSDATLQPARPPRGLILSTGEVTPRGQSLRARMLVVELPPGALDWARVTACQQDAGHGLFAAAFAGYVQWLAPRLDEVRQGMPARLAALREQATASGMHKRTPAIVANLFFGLELFTEFAVLARALSKKQASAFRERCWKALGEAATAQAEVQAHGEPARRFLEALNAAIAAGRAHVAGLDGQAPPSPAGLGWREEEGKWAPQGDRVGWVDGQDLYLEPDAAHAAAQRMGQDGHEPLGVEPKSLHKRLHEQGHLVGTDTTRGRLSVRKSLEGRVRTVLHLRAEVLGAASAAAPITPPSVPAEGPPEKQ